MRAALSVVALAALAGCASAPPAVAPEPRVAADPEASMAIFAGQTMEAARPGVEQALTECLAVDPRYIDAEFDATRLTDGDAGAAGYLYRYHRGEETLLRVDLTPLTPTSGAATLSGVLATRADEELIADAAYGKINC